jgi:trimethylamine--corrinoid protein Co-methyltransferase
MALPPPVRPQTQLLSPSLSGRIIDEAFDVLAKVGVLVDHPEAKRILLGAGATEGPGDRVLLARTLVERALATAPRRITFWDVPGDRSFTVGENDVHFDPGSAALHIFDHRTQSRREAVTADLVEFHSLTQRLEDFHFQSTGLVSSDVPREVADCYRMFVAFQHCGKPIVTGTFVQAGFGPMLEMLTLLRGGSGQLRARPLAVFDACPSPPLKWSPLTAQSVLDCARAGIPSEFVAMPLTGATAPVTLSGALVQHVAENFSGIAIAQGCSPGAPVIFGGSPASFDHRKGTPPMGAMETMMIDMAYSQIAKSLGLPTHAYMGLSDAKCVDAQAGLETGMGAVLAALAGINVVSGGGMMAYENCISLEKLVIDHQIIRMAYRLIEGVTQRDEVMALDIFRDILHGDDFMGHPHTVRWLRQEHWYPRLIDRGGPEEWEAEGKPTLADRAAEERARLAATGGMYALDASVGSEMRKIMQAHGKPHGLTLPS